ncbi:uncharacterized protein LOC132034924 [Lycium ferocissimum]|uniref:uncharacterized protein LOC132034924 n=1 Tax=Lycium ferocissimum TaxID=112874 RepID=UPI0028160761|nr:uncharacterized protein LOC132034924 [Lycium ferocissimum]
MHGEDSNVTMPKISKNTRVKKDTLQPQNLMETMINDACGFTGNNVNDTDMSSESINRNEIFNEEHIERHNEDYAKFYEMIEDGKQPLYEGCTKYSKLSVLIKLYHIKCLCRMTNKAMSVILDLLKDAFEDVKIPVSFYEAKKTINKLGLNYTKIHACPNDCILYFGEDNEGLQECKKCKTSRWKDNKKKQPAKILRYFPLKRRLQRLFMCSKTVESIRWHSLEGNQDGLMRHPRDSQAWKTFGLLHPEFATDPRNVRLVLASDGFNPFGAMSTNYRKQMPGNDIDVYLQPLIQELRELWYDGVQTLDSSKNEIFKMRAALMWTISDFPGLDIMHIEKNVCENVIYTLLNDSGKSKDNSKARKDLREMGIRKELWEDENGNYCPSLFTILNTKKNGFMKNVFLRTLKNVKMPDGYASNKMY